MGTIELAELEGWDTIQKAISKQKRILEGGSSDLPFTPDENMMLYSTIFNMCTENPDCCQQLYDKYRETLEEYITSSVLPSLREKHGEFLLRELSKRWENHEVMYKWLSKCFDYLERFFVHRDTVLRRSLKVVGITIFRKLVYREFKTKVRYLVLTLIDKEREGEQIDTALLKNVINIFVETGIVQVTSYAIDFERYMLEKSEAYYSHKSSNWILEYSSGFDYMSKVEECLKKERDRVSHYLHSSSEPKLVEIVERELVLVHATELLERDHSGFCNLIIDDKVENLSRMYRVYHKLPHVLEPIANFFEQHIAAQGSVQRTKEVFVRELIELNEKYMAYVTDCFQNHRLFRKALKEALKRFCKNAVSGSSSAELLATFCHDILKKGGRGKLSDEVIEDTLEKVVKLLAYIVDIDLFFAFCRRNFACRLLFRRSGNDDHERSFLTKLKQQCGDPFTSKMERMVTDLTLSREIQKDFKEYLKTTGKNPGIDLKVTVLNTGYWPTFRSSYLNLPTEMVKCREVFNDFYKSKTVDRKLKWIYGLGTCLVDGNFEKKTIELSVNTYQAVLLLLFNSSDILSYSEIMTQLNVTHDDLVRLLHSLSCAKYKILSKDPKTETISKNDYFEFNSEFTDVNRRIKIPFPQVNEKRVIEEVIKSRRYSIERTIVRQMKSQKAMRQQHLVADCVYELRCMFEPDIKEINKRIDSLISREYLERDRDDPKILKYLA